MIHFQAIATANASRLTALWKCCFGDSEALIGTFWRHFPSTATVYAAVEEEKPLCMLCVLPTSLVGNDGEALPAAYFYALCTAPEYRGCGLASSLLRYAEAELKKAGICATLLVPESKALFSYYAAQGYQTVFYCNVYILPAASHGVSIRRIAAAEAFRLRQTNLYGAFVDWDEAFLSLQEQLCGGLFRIETENDVCCAIAEIRGETLKLTELLPNCPEAAAALAFQLGCTAVEIRAPGESLPFGMAKSLTDCALPEQAYLGPALD